MSLILPPPPHLLSLLLGHWGKRLPAATEYSFFLLVLASNVKTEALMEFLERVIKGC